MIVLGVQIETPCPTCGVAIPVNAVVPTLTCPGCARVLTTSAPGWKQLVQDVLASAGALALGEGKMATVWTPDGRFAVRWTRMAPRCEACKLDLPMAEATASASRGACVCSCGARVSVRALPPSFGPDVMPGVTLLLGEAADQIAIGAGAARRRETIAVHCSQCGGALTADGSSRTITCVFCRASTLVPDAVWARLHPAAAVARWFVCVSGETRAAPTIDAAFFWNDLCDALADVEGNFYGVGRLARSDSACVFSFDRDMKRRWVQGGLPFDARSARVAVTADGWLLVWEPTSPAVLVFACRDGAPSGQLGGVEPPGVRVHHLEATQLRCLACDMDGTMLAIFQQRLLRFARDGRGVPTWSTSERLAPMWRPCPEVPDEQLLRQRWDAKLGRVAVDASEASGFNWMDFEMETVGKRPLAFGWNCHPTVHVGWDGCVYALANDSSDSWIAKFDREGKRRWSIKLPVDDMEGGARPQADGWGNAFALGSLRERGAELRILVRIASDGGKPQTVLKDQRMGGPLTNADEILVVARDASFTVLGDGGRMKSFAPDGTLRFASATAR